VSLSRSLVLSFYSENSILIGLIDFTEVFLDRSADYSAIPNKESGRRSVLKLQRHPKSAAHVGWVLF
jgi:hypothetical protein